jgi:hypothetical protein
VTAPPAPVEPLPVLPSVASQAMEGTQQMSGLAMDAQRNLARAAAARAAAASAGTVVEETVVPITKAASLTRAAGGVLLISPNIGWAIGQGGLVAYATATGTDYTTMICNTPDWYQGTNAFLSFGITADCKGTMVQPNADKQGTPTLTYSGTTITVVGRTTFSSSLSGTQGIPSNWPYNWCVTGQPPAGTQLQSRDYVTSSRWTVVFPTAGTGGQYSCASGRFDMSGAYSTGGNNYANTDTLRLVSDAGHPDDGSEPDADVQDHLEGRDDDDGHRHGVQGIDGPPGVGHRPGVRAGVCVEAGCRAGPAAVQDRR